MSGKMRFILDGLVMHSNLPTASEKWVYAFQEMIFKIMVY
jgi:hypothetical protein